MECCRTIPDECFEPCVDEDDGEVAEFGYRLRDGRRFRRYVVKRIPVAVGVQTSLEPAADTDHRAANAPLPDEGWPLDRPFPDRRPVTAAP